MAERAPSFSPEQEEQEPISGEREKEKNSKDPEDMPIGAALHEDFKQAYNQELIDDPEKGRGAKELLEKLAKEKGSVLPQPSPKPAEGTDYIEENNLRP
jgi:hypothetical protein